MEREPNAKLAELIHQAGMSRSGLARRVVNLAEGHGIARHYTHIDVTRWLVGTQPRGIVPGLIAEVLSTKLGRPVSMAEIGFVNCDDGVLLGATAYPQSLGAAVATVAAIARADSTAATPGREELDAAAWADLMVHWLLAPDVAPPISDDWDDGRVRALGWATDMFSKLDYQFGGGYARTSLVEYLRTELALLLDSPRGATPELLRPAAALLRLAGWTAYDTGHHWLATRYLTQALAFAQAAGDRALGGRILAGMSHQAHFLGYHEHAANLARVAQRGAKGHATPTAMALFHAMEARALAGMGDRRGTEAALIAAESWFDKRAADNDPPWLRYFDSAELAAEFAHSYRDLGMAKEAIEFGMIAVYDADPLYARSVAFCRCVLAAGHLGKSEIEQGLELASAAVTAASSLRSVRAREYVRDFVDRLAAYGQHPPVVEFIERATHALSAAPGVDRAG